MSFFTRFSGSKALITTYAYVVLSYVSMLAVFVTLVCACVYMFSGLRPDAGRGPMDICMLCIYVIIDGF